MFFKREVQILTTFYRGSRHPASLPLYTIVRASPPDHLPNFTLPFPSDSIARDPPLEGVLNL